MGSYDGAEVYELVGLFILNSLEKTFGKNVGLYRDDGLAAINTSSARLADKTRKDIIQIFNNIGLKITTQINLKSTNFLDITLNLSNGTYQPYRKPNDEPLYINKRSNHPPAILKQLPMSINKRISNLSCNQETFETAAPIYENALRHSNFVTQLAYIENESDDQTNASQTRQQKNHSRNINWCNPPYSRNVGTNSGRTFLNLIDKHFTKTNKLHKILNRNTVKVSYSCMENIKNVIRRHNNRILVTPRNRSTEDKCNCRKKDECPLPGKCLTRTLSTRPKSPLRTRTKQRKHTLG